VGILGITWTASVILVAMFFFIIAIPCLFVAVLGYKMLGKLAYFPSKNPAIQTDMFFWLVLTEIVSITLLLAFYHTFAE